MKSGAYDYIQKPFEPEQLKTILTHALERRALSHEIAALRAELSRNRGTSTLVGNDPKFLEVLATLKQVAPTDAPVLILGESGTGKELMAGFLHQHSRRSGNPMVAVNCAAMPETLLESEVFGFARGAFTDAHKDRAGLLEEAGGGTFFMDEVGETSPVFQAKMLRVLQEREVRRLGENTSRPVDFRLVSATHADIDQKIRDGSLREDFLYRMNVITVHLPALRERPGDIPLLINHFLNQQAAKLNREKPTVSESAMEALLAYPWPGNIRELANVMERAAVLCVEGEISRNLLGQKFGGVPASSEGRPAAVAPAVTQGEQSGPVIDLETQPTVAHIETTYLRYLLQEKGMTLAQVAEVTGLSLSTLKRRKRELKQ
jgi:DNA-binding NtrC family response regulator